LKPTLFLRAAIVATTLVLFPFAGHAAKKPKPISEADAAALPGKTAAVTLYEVPAFSAMTSGKATLGMFGALGMIKAGNDFVRENAIQDPAVLLREQLGQLLRDVHGMQVLPVDSVETKESKPAKIAKLHPETDYVLSVRGILWNYGYYPTDWSHYRLTYMAIAHLIDTRTGRSISEASCLATTSDNPNRPTRDQLHANGAQLTKDVFTGLGWTCLQLLAKEQFRVPADKVPAIPAEYVDPLARLQPAVAAPATAPAATAQPQSMPETTTEPEPATEPATPAEPPATDVPAARTS
jgi:hypothetical protein